MPRQPPARHALRRCCASAAPRSRRWPAQLLGADVVWGDGVATVHYDGTANRYLQADGQRFTPPSNAARAPPAPRHGSSRQAQQTELGAVDWAAHGIAPLEATLQPGDVLYMPAFVPPGRERRRLGRRQPVDRVVRATLGLCGGGDDPSAAAPRAVPRRRRRRGGPPPAGERTAQLGLVEQGGGRASARAPRPPRVVRARGDDAPEWRRRTPRAPSAARRRRSRAPPAAIARWRRRSSTRTRRRCARRTIARASFCWTTSSSRRRRGRSARWATATS